MAVKVPESGTREIRIFVPQADDYIYYTMKPITRERYNQYLSDIQKDAVDADHDLFDELCTSIRNLETEAGEPVGLETALAKHIPFAHKSLVLKSLTTSSVFMKAEDPEEVKKL